MDLKDVKVKYTQADINKKSDTDVFLEKNQIGGLKNLGPIVVCPGLGGSSLDFELDRKMTPKVCRSFLNNIFLGLEKSLWLNPLGLSIQRSCFLRMLEPDFNSTTGNLTNMPGLRTAVHTEGNILTSKCLSYITKTSLCFPTTSYARNFINFFTKAGYVANENLLIIGYDFRFVPYKNYADIYFNILQHIIEVTATKYHQKINVVGHSLGCSLLNIFLNTRPLTWKQQYINQFFSVSPAYDGAPKGLRACLSGENFGLPANFFGENRIWRTAQRKMAGILFTLPLHPQMYGTNDKNKGLALILTNVSSSQSCCVPSWSNCKCYNVMNFPDSIIGLLRALSHDLGDTELNISAQILSNMNDLKLKYGWSDPAVSVHQLMITKISTEAGGYVYDIKKGGLSSNPISNLFVLGDGDIPIFGFMIPKMYGWKNVTYQEFPNNKNHFTLFTDSPPAYEYILNVIVSKKS